MNQLSKTGNKKTSKKNQSWNFKTTENTAGICFW
jgi:hypothetical protein